MISSFYSHFQWCQNGEDIYYISTTKNDSTEIWCGKEKTNGFLK